MKTIKRNCSRGQILLVTLVLVLSNSKIFCQEQKQDKNAPSGMTFEQQLNYNRAKEKNLEAYNASKDYLNGQKVEFIKDLQRNFAELQDDMRAVDEEVREVTAELKVEAQKKLQDLELKKDRLESEVDRVLEATAENWKEVEAECKQHLQEVKKSVREMRKWLSEKIAP